MPTSSPLESPIFCGDLTAEGALTVAFIPVFTNYLAKEGKAEAIKVTQIVFTFLAIFFAVITLFGIVFARPLTQFFAPGFVQEPEKFEMAVSLTRWMFPYIFFVSLVALAMGVLNALRHFMAPAMSPVLFNLCNIICAILFYPLLDEPILGLGVRSSDRWSGAASISDTLFAETRYSFAV